MARGNRKRKNRKKRRRERRAEEEAVTIQKPDKEAIDALVNERIAEGTEFGEGLNQKFLSGDALSASRSAEDAELIALKRAQLSGLSPEEEMLMRETGLAAQAQEFAGADRLLGGSNIGGVRGRAGAARFNPLLRQKFEQRNELERGISTEKANRRAAALESFGTSLGDIQARELGLAKDKLATEQGSIGALSSLRGGLEGNDLAFQNLQAQQDAQAKALRQQNRQLNRFQRQSNSLV